MDGDPGGQTWLRRRLGARTEPRNSARRSRKWAGPTGLDALEGRKLMSIATVGQIVVGETIPGFAAFDITLARGGGLQPATYSLVLGGGIAEKSTAVGTGDYADEIYVRDSQTGQLRLLPVLGRAPTNNQPPAGGHGHGHAQPPAQPGTARVLSFPGDFPVNSRSVRVFVPIIDNQLIQPHDRDFYLAVQGRGRVGMGRAIIVDNDVIGPHILVTDTIVPEGPMPVRPVPPGGVVLRPGSLIGAWRFRGR